MSPNDGVEIDALPVHNGLVPRELDRLALEDGGDDEGGRRREAEHEHEPADAAEDLVREDVEEGQEDGDFHHAVEGDVEELCGPGGSEQDFDIRVFQHPDVVSEAVVFEHGAVVEAGDFDKL